MNKTIIISLAMIAAVGVIATGVTVSYFSDTETSLGNTFTAGGLDLTIDSDCHFNGMNCICPSGGTYCYWDTNDNGSIEGDEVMVENRCDCKWDAKDLVNEKFFNFTGLKPGDSGEATISMHASGDNFYVRSKTYNVQNKDNGCNEPELKAEETKYGAGLQTCGTSGGGADEGELGANMDFVIWADMGTEWGYQCLANEPGCAADSKEGDNILNTQYEYITYLATSQTPDPGENWSYVKNAAGNDWEFLDGSTYYMGVAWCVGTLSVNSSSYAITCDGSSAKNIIQSDSYTSDMSFEVMQATHSSSTNPWGT